MSTHSPGAATVDTGQLCPGLSVCSDSRIVVMPVVCQRCVYYTSFFLPPAGIQPEVAEEVEMRHGE